MTKRKLALVCQSGAALLSALVGRCACWLTSKAVWLGYFCQVGAELGALCPSSQGCGWANPCGTVSAGRKTTVVLHKARGWYEPSQVLLAVCFSRGFLFLPVTCLLLCWGRAVSTRAGRCSWEQVSPLFLHSERQTHGQVLFITTDCILPALLLNSVYL